MTTHPLTLHEHTLFHSLLAHILEPYHFFECLTDEPNVGMDPANILLVRIGQRVELEVVNQLFRRKEHLMMPNPYLYEKVAQAHHEDLMREAAQRRLLAHRPGHARSMSRRAAGKLGILLLKLGTWLKQFEQLPPAL